MVKREMARSGSDVGPNFQLPTTRTPEAHISYFRYRSRALLLKRHGDAYQRSPSAQPQFASLPSDPLKGLLCLTDAVLLWLYAYFCEEQAGGRVRGSPYNESAPLREFVRKSWESEIRRAESDETKEMARGMVGLL